VEFNVWVKTLKPLELEGTGTLKAWCTRGKEVQTD